MLNEERTRLIELTKNAIKINERLLADEKKFVEDVEVGNSPVYLSKMNESLNELCSAEHLYLAAAKSLLQIVNKKD